MTNYKLKKEFSTHRARHLQKFCSAFLKASENLYSDDVGRARYSEALPMHNRWARFIILLLGNPHLLERTQGGQNRASDPHGVFPLRRGHNLDFHRGGSKRGQLLRHALADTLKHRCAARQNDVGIKILANVDVTLHDTLESRVMYPARFLPDKARLEQNLWAPEAL